MEGFDQIWSHILLWGSYIHSTKYEQNQILDIHGVVSFQTHADHIDSIYQ